MALWRVVLPLKATPLNPHQGPPPPQTVNPEVQHPKALNLKILNPKPERGTVAARLLCADFCLGERIFGLGFRAKTTKALEL